MLMDSELERALKAFLHAARNPPEGAMAEVYDTQIVQALVAAIRRMIDEAKGPTIVGPQRF